MKTEMSSEKCVISITNCISNLRGNKKSILCSSAVEPTTVNRLVAGSNPAGGVRNLRRSNQGASNTCWDKPPWIFTTEFVSYSIANCQNVGLSAPSSIRRLVEKHIRISVMYYIRPWSNPKLQVGSPVFARITQR